MTPVPRPAVGGGDEAGGAAGLVAAAAPPVDSETLAVLADRVPVIAVLTVGGRWVGCEVTDAGMAGGFRTWRAVPEDPDLRRSEVVMIWNDIPPWSPAIGLLCWPDECGECAAHPPVAGDGA